LIYQRAGRYQQAMESYRQAQQLNPRFEPPVIHLGNTFLQLGRYRDAIAQYDHYREIAPSDFELQRARLGLATAYWLKGDLRQAEAQLVQRWPDLQNAHPLSLMVAVELGKVPAEMAIQRLEREINAGGRPNNRGARHTFREDSYYRGLFELRRGRPEEATKNFTQALREAAPYWSPNPMEDCLANAYLQVGKPNEAIAEYRRILRINPNDARVRYHLGEALERTGNLPAAKAEFDRFLEIWKDADADAPEVSGARHHLASLQPAAARNWRNRSRD
jgi:tetratricopeptide (TPR) repeat protein